MFETLKALIQETKPSIYLLVSDDIVDSSNEDEPMVSCSVQWVWQDDNDNWHSDWGMVMTIPDGVDYTADDVGKAMVTIMHRLTLARIERA